MLSPQGLEFIETIEPTRENAQAMLKLTLQDVKLGGFKNPLSLADPSSEDMISAQQQKLCDHPERYSGYARNGELVAYIKQGEWLAGDELPFAHWFSFLSLKVQRALHKDPHTGMWGIFGLVAANDLGTMVQKNALALLLMGSREDPVSKNTRRIVNVAIHEYDPLLDIAKNHGFVAVGRRGNAAGAPGLKQRRYQWRLTSK